MMRLAAIMASSISAGCESPGGPRNGFLGGSPAGAAIGGAVMTPIVNWAIAARGWKFGYLVVAAPMALITIPMLIALVRTRPPAEVGPERPASEPTPAPIELPGHQ